MIEGWTESDDSPLVTARLDPEKFNEFVRLSEERRQWIERYHKDDDDCPECNWGPGTTRHGPDCSVPRLIAE